MDITPCWVYEKAVVALIYHGVVIRYAQVSARRIFPFGDDRVYRVRDVRGVSVERRTDVVVANRATEHATHFVFVIDLTKYLHLRLILLGHDVRNDLL